MLKTNLKNPINKINFENIKLFSLVFIIVQLLDILTTIIGIRYFGCVEANPFASIFGIYGFWIYKLIVIIIVSTVMQLYDLKWGNKLIICVAGIPIAWNMLNIILEWIL